MGWFYTLGASRSDIIKEVTATAKMTNAQGRSVTSTCIARSFSGNHLWTVWEQVWSDDTPDERFICLFILCNSRGRSDGSWGYKPVEESMGPTAQSCPLKFLEMTPQPTNEWSGQWRAGVRTYWTQRRNRLRARKEQTHA